MYIYIFLHCVCLSVCPSVRVVDHALTAVLIDFIFGMHIDVIPGSDIGISFFSFLILKDHLRTKYLKKHHFIALKRHWVGLGTL